MRSTSPNRFLLPALVLSQCLTCGLGFQGQRSFSLFPPRRALSPLHKSAATWFRLINPNPRRWSSHQHGGDNTDDANLSVLQVVPGEEQVTVTRLQTENEQLRESLRQMEIENQRLQHDVSTRIILETFEGEGKQTGEDVWCDELEGDSCPVEPMISFGEALRDRAYWLVGLLILQSGSGIILARNEALLANHPVIIYFLTMLVGAGGNAGNQASVRVIRGLALGTLNEKTQNQFLARELKMAASLSCILSVTGFVRAICFSTPLPESIAVTAALSLIVFTSICLGAILPLILKRMGIDPAHSSTSIQVIMDILGVFCAVVVSGLVLDSALGAMLISKLTGGYA